MIAFVANIWVSIKILALKLILRLKIQDISQTYIITSSPRSGSTWLLNLISQMQDAIVLFEPLHLNHIPEARVAGFTWRTYKDPEADWPSGKAFLRKVFKGGVLNQWILKETSVREALKSTKIIIKFVRATRLLPWIVKHFELRAPILLLRHPCAVIASQLMSEDWNQTTKPDIPDFMREVPRWTEIFDQATSVEEYLAIYWALDYLPAFMCQQPVPWQIITYEDLVQNPQAVLQGISENWNMKIKKTQIKYETRSSTTHKNGISGLSGWQTALTEQQKQNIMQIIHAFGFTFYVKDSPFPDHALMHTQIIYCEHT